MLKDNIRIMVEEKLLGSKLFLTGMVVKPGNRIMVFVDGDEAVTIDDCQQLSRYLESQLDREIEDYELTVSSAGADRPLIMARQYPKHIGRNLNIVTHAGEQVAGKLADTDNERIYLEQEFEISKKETGKRIVVLDLNEIRSATVEVRFKK